MAEKGIDRRCFLQRFLEGGAAVLLTTAKGGEPPQTPSPSAPARGYRETEHIRTFYAKAREA